jgi:hypothetical protein
MAELQVRGFAPIGMMECWNNGIMDYRIMQFGVNDKICVEDKIKNGYYPFKNQPSSIPLFHCSIFEASVKTSKYILFFQQVIEFSRRFNYRPINIDLVR